jgi:hypothetical protein
VSAVRSSCAAHPASGPDSHRPTGTGKPSLGRAATSGGSSSRPIARRSARLVVRPPTFSDRASSAATANTRESRNGTRSSAQRHRRRVGQRVVEVPHDAGQVLEHVRRGHGRRRGGQVEGLRGPAGEGGLVVAVLVEPDRERPQVGAVLPGEGADRRRVHAAGQERAERHVAAQVGPHRVGQHREDAARGGRAGTGGGPQVGPPVAGLGRRLAGPDRQRVARPQRPHAGRERGRTGHVLEREVAAQGVTVDGRPGRRPATARRPRRPRRLDQRLLLRCGPQQPPRTATARRRAA